MRNTDKYLQLGGFGILFYIVLKAVTVDITHDEAYTFYIAKNFWYAEALCTGNTHWINTLSVMFSILLKCEREWQIRWFALFSATVFILLTLLFVKKEQRLSAKLLLFSVLLLNPYITGYFSIARGYASGLMFEMLCLWFFVRSLQEENAGSRFLSLFFAGAAALANFGFIYFFAAFNVIYFRKRRKFDAGMIRDLIFSLGIFALVGRAFKFMMDCTGDVVGAGTPSFFESFHGFVYGLINGKFGMPSSVYDVLAVISFLLIIWSALYGVIYRKQHGKELYLIASVLLLLIYVMVFSGRVFFGIVFPYYRSNIFLFPLTAVCFVYFFSSHIRSAKVTDVLCTSFSVILMLNFVMSLNLTSVFEWHGQVNMKEVFQDLENAGVKDVGLSDELYGGFRNYYQATDDHRYDFRGYHLRTCAPAGIDTAVNRLARYDHLALFPPYDLSHYRYSKVRFEGLDYYEGSKIVTLKVIRY